jgi:hypothetical protein
MTLSAMEWQFRKISQKLRTSEPWQSMITEFPELQTTVSELGPQVEGGDKAIRRSILQLYTRYITEWDKYSARKRLLIRAKAA